MSWEFKYMDVEERLCLGMAGESCISLRKVVHNQPPSLEMHRMAIE
jgi:hypothetical protein